MALPGFDAIVNEAKFTKPTAAGDVAKAIIAEQRKQGGKYIQDRADDAKNSNSVLFLILYLKNRPACGPQGGLTTKRAYSGIVQGSLIRCLQ